MSNEGTGLCVSQLVKTIRVRRLLGCVSISCGDKSTTNWVTDNNRNLLFHGSGGQSLNLKCQRALFSLKVWGGAALISSGSWCHRQSLAFLGCRSSTLISASAITGSSCLPVPESLRPFFFYKDTIPIVSGLNLIATTPISI